MRRDELTVTFVEGLKAPLPQPWQPAGVEARIPWTAVDPGSQPDPDHPVYLVVFGTTDDGALVGLNLAAFSRLRLGGDPATANTLANRWVLELLATHPAITIGVTTDVWHGPLTTRVRPVAPGRVPDVDVLVLGAGLTYAERAQIVAAATSAILLDLGEDAAVTTTWTITCGPDRLGQISRGSSRPMTATLIIPSADVVDLCTDLLATPSPAAAAQPGHIASPPPSQVDEFDADLAAVGGPDKHTAVDDTDPALPVVNPSGPLLDPTGPTPRAAAGAAAEPAAGIDFFAPPPAPPAAAQARAAQRDNVAPGGGDGAAAGLIAWAAAESEQPVPDRAVPAETRDPVEVSPAVGATDPAVDKTADVAAASAPPTAPIWNRILGQVALRPPHSTQQPGNREKRLNELTSFLQCNPWATSNEIIARVYGGASEKTVTQQVSLLRARLGVVRPGGPKALPTMRDSSGYHLDNAVRSDWMEFERLVEILAETTPTPNLVAAMDLVTGPPLGGIGAKEWAWATNLRDELRDRVAGAAVVLARRHHMAKQFGAAVQVARKGLWYDNARQDLWQVALQAALAGHDKDTFRALRSQYLNTVPSHDRDPAVYDLTGRSG